MNKIRSKIISMFLIAIQPIFETKLANASEVISLGLKLDDAALFVMSTAERLHFPLVLNLEETCKPQYTQCIYLAGEGIRYHFEMLNRPEIYQLSIDMDTTRVDFSGSRSIEKFRQACAIIAATIKPNYNKKRLQKILMVVTDQIYGSKSKEINFDGLNFYGARDSIDGLRKPGGSYITCGIFTL